MEGCGRDGGGVDEVTLEGDDCGCDDGLREAEEDTGCLSEEGRGVYGGLMGWMKGLEVGQLRGGDQRV